MSNAFEPSGYMETTPRDVSVATRIAGGIALVLGIIGIPLGCCGVAGGLASSVGDASLLLDPSVREAFRLHQEAASAFQMFGLLLSFAGVFVSVAQAVSGGLALAGRPKPLFVVALVLVAWHLLVGLAWPVLVQALTWSSFQAYLEALAAMPGGELTMYSTYLGILFALVLSLFFAAVWGAIAVAARS